VFRYFFQLLGLALLLTSCSLGGPIRVDRTAAKYFFPEPLPGWQKLAPKEEAEILYKHTQTGALLSVSSLCDRYEESKLETLTRSALSSIEAQKDRDQKTFQLNGRDAFELYIDGKVDGVPVQVDYVSWRKNDCLFDFSLQDAPEISPKVREDFLAMIKKAHYP
jgi:hypothetical protein